MSSPTHCQLRSSGFRWERDVPSFARISTVVGIVGAGAVWVALGGFSAETHFAFSSLFSCFSGEILNLLGVDG